VGDRGHRAGLPDGSPMTPLASTWCAAGFRRRKSSLVSPRAPPED
jgi:hypothetical protein